MPKETLPNAFTVNAVDATGFAIAPPVTNGVAKQTEITLFPPAPKSDNNAPLDESVHLYMKEISKIPVLTHQREIALCERIAKATASAFLLQAFQDDKEVQPINELSPPRLTQNILEPIPMYNSFAALPFEFIVRKPKKPNKKINTKNKDGSDMVREGIVTSIKLLPDHDPKTLFNSNSEYDDFIQQLYANLKNGQEAKQELIIHNLRLVANIAKEYASKMHPLSDLIQEGNLGLYKAVEKFDETRGYKFSSYATWWIIQAITKARSNTGNVIRIPIHIKDALSSLDKTEREFYLEYHRHPIPLEAAVYEFQQTFLKTNNRLPNPEEFTDEQIQNVCKRAKYIVGLKRARAIQPKSLESPLLIENREESDQGLGSFIEADSDVAKYVLNRVFIKDAIDQVGLSKRELYILYMVYVLEFKLKDVGDKLPRPVTKERVRQIHAQALKKLRSSLNVTDSET
ncbi:MAG: hypothetical protein A3D75_02570 [Candidatus Levybacteria bacterium RIFCSPHIGHO2_02_FULL_37_18]|nr:MAG: hypothetical protein A3D75_02570 [Candidatus Levybacteria bacterium RIFCSPHIGHO2_02_FULL_37_18]